MNSNTQQSRILAVSLSSRGFGYAVMEDGGALVDYGKTTVKGEKNALALARIGKVIARSVPDQLVLQDVNARGTFRCSRIKRLDRRIVALSRKRKLRVAKIAARELRRLLLGSESGTKLEMAELMAKRFPDELSARLPAGRRPWESEDARMDIFGAVGLAVAHRQRQEDLPTRA